MGSSETDEPAKDAKTPPSGCLPEQSAAVAMATVNAEWPGYQAYAHIPPPGYMASNPQTHPYMWSVQGSYPYAPFATPAPNGTVETSGNTHGSADAENKQSEVKEKLPVKRMRESLGNLNMITGKNNKEDQTTKTAANGDCSKSAESGSDGSSEGSDANYQNDSSRKTVGRQEAGEAEVSQNGNSTYITQNGAVNIPQTMVNHAIAVVPMPATNLNIGMEYWGTPVSSPGPVVAPGMVSAGSRDNLQSQPWLQDERELKRQRRKQSNRECARRSRLRKQERLGESAEELGSSQIELRLANGTQENVKPDQV